MAKKTKIVLEAGLYRELSDREQETMKGIFDAYDTVNFMVIHLDNLLKQESERTWKTFYETFPEYVDWNVKWNRVEKTLKVLYPRKPD